MLTIERYLFCALLEVLFSSRADFLLNKYFRYTNACYCVECLLSTSNVSRNRSSSRSFHHVNNSGGYFAILLFHTLFTISRDEYRNIRSCAQGLFEIAELEFLEQICSRENWDMPSCLWVDKEITSEITSNFKELNLLITKILLLAFSDQEVKRCMLL